MKDLARKIKRRENAITRLDRAMDWGVLIMAALLSVVLILMFYYILQPHDKEDEKPTETTPASTVSVIKPSEAKVDAEYEWEAAFREEVSAQVDVVPERKHIGKCRLTVYTPTETHWGYTTATGVKSQHLMTCAVDPNVIPYGSNVIIVAKDGSELRLKAVDCGNFTGKWVDIFFDGTERHGIVWLDETLGEWGDVYIEVAK